jgi:hypothetical protein
MPEITAYGKIFRDWEGLIGSCNQHASLIAGVEPLRAGLEAILAQARDTKVQQESLAGSRQAATQGLRDMVADGREVARKIRFFVRVQLGSRSELLTAFGVRPIRAKLRKVRPGEVPPPAAPVAGPGEG